MLYSQESGSIRSPINTEAFPLVIIIGDRERANLIIQLARFFGICIYVRGSVRPCRLSRVHAGGQRARSLQAQQVHDQRVHAGCQR